MKLLQFKDKPGTILDAFSEFDGEHLGTIMVLKLPPIMAHHPADDQVPIVIIKQALPIKRRSCRLSRGSAGLWADCNVKVPQ